MARGVIASLMFSDCPLDREPDESLLLIARTFGEDDGLWCREHGFDADPPPHLKHPQMIDAWREGYHITR